MKRLTEEKTAGAKLKGNRSISELSELLNDKGVYTLVISTPVEKQIAIGKMGSRKFPEGYYAYTGSALGKGATSLGGRILRHLREDKRKRWHIDYLLADDNVSIVTVIAAHTGEQRECRINRLLRNALQAEALVSRFGSSDCHEGCGSHLLYLGRDKKVIRKIVELYIEGMDAQVHVLEIS